MAHGTWWLIAGNLAQSCAHQPDFEGRPVRGTQYVLLFSAMFKALQGVSEPVVTFVSLKGRRATKSGNRHVSLSNKLKHDCFSAGEEEGKAWHSHGEAVGNCKYICVLPTPIHVRGGCARKRRLVGFLLNMKLASLSLDELDNHSSAKLWIIFINQAIYLFL